VSEVEGAGGVRRGPAGEASKPVQVFGTHDEATLSQMRDVVSRAERGALMADGHVGYVMPIGGVAAYDDKVSVVGVGFDIACGNCAIRTDLTPDAVGDGRRWQEVATEIERTISFGLGRTNRADDAPTHHPLFESAAWEAVPAQERGRLKAKAREQLGTVGSGNHYVDVFVDEGGAVWVGVHFGSRGLGHTVASWFLALWQNRQWGERVPETEVLLPLKAPIGDAYWSLMTLAGDYAYAGREWVARKVVALLGGRETDLVHNNHNFAWIEEHEGRSLVVVRKGATPAFPGQRGFVGGSMGDDAVIVAGALTEDSEAADVQRAALYSTVHGAGRVMSRTEAAGKRNRRTGEVKRPGRVTPEMMREWVGRKGVILRGGGLDESPHAYRRLPDVLAAQEGTIVVEHTLRPLVVVMAGANEFDPYKD
jgi:tRNA-splicing ligase RtcB